MSSLTLLSWSTLPLAVVWANTIKLGCGYTACSDMDYVVWCGHRLGQAPEGGASVV